MAGMLLKLPNVILEYESESWFESWVWSWFEVKSWIDSWIESWMEGESWVGLKTWI